MKVIHKAGKRKEAVAKATLRAGTGRVMINRTPLEHYEPELSRLRLKEPLVLAGDTVSKYDISIKTKGGGVQSQTEAARLALGRCLAETSKTLRATLIKFDRHLIVADVRYKEMRKPNDSKARAKRQKSYR